MAEPRVVARHNMTRTIAAAAASPARTPAPSSSSYPKQQLVKVAVEFPGSAIGWAGILWFGLLQGSSWSQVVVTNGLSHFHRGPSQAGGYIELWNPTPERQTAILIRDSLLGPMNDLQIASEVHIPPKARVRMNYQWLREDSSSQGVRVFVSTAAHRAAAPEVQAGRILVQLSTLLWLLPLVPLGRASRRTTLGLRTRVGNRRSRHRWAVMQEDT